MSILDKKLFLADLQAQLDEYVPAATVKKIISDAGELLTDYELTAIQPDAEARARMSRGS